MPRFARPFRFTLAAAGVLALAACESATDVHVFSLDETGRVVGFLFRDNDLSGSFNPAADSRLRDQEMQLRMRGSRINHEVSRTDTAGLFAFSNAPFGTYRVLASDALLGDSLEAVPPSDAEFLLGARDTVFINFAVRYRTVTITEARALAFGARRWVSGVVLNQEEAFGDSTVHLTDGTSAIRASTVRPVPISIGDSVLMLGVRSTRDGQPTIEVTSVAIRANGPPPAPDTLTSAVAATAQNGARDAALVIVRNVLVTDTATVMGSRILTVDDGSGPLQIVLSTATINFNPLADFVPGAMLDATGLLVPTPGGGGTWRLKPRFRPDVVRLN